MYKLENNIIEKNGEQIMKDIFFREAKTNFFMLGILLCECWERG
jgi:hypothetical protein